MSTLCSSNKTDNEQQQQQQPTLCGISRDVDDARPVCDVVADVESAAVEAARRCLFGQVDRPQIRADLDAVNRQFDASSRLRWNFDFKTGRPLALPVESATSVRYMWTPVPKPIAVTTVSRRGRKMTSLHAVYSDQHDVAETNPAHRRMSTGCSMASALNIACSPHSAAAIGKSDAVIREPLRLCSPVEVRHSARRSSCFALSTSSLKQTERQSSTDAQRKLARTPETVKCRRRSSRASSVVDYFPNRKTSQLFALGSKRRL